MWGTTFPDRRSRKVPSFSTLAGQDAADKLPQGSTFTTSVCGSRTPSLVLSSFEKSWACGFCFRITQDAFPSTVSLNNELEDVWEEWKCFQGRLNVARH